MAAVTKAFLGTSLRAAVPTQGQVPSKPQSVVAVGAAMPSQSVSCMFALSDVFYFSSGPGAFIVPALRIFCCRSLTDSTGDLQGNKQTTRAAIEFYGPDRAKFLGYCRHQVSVAGSACSSAVSPMASKSSKLTRWSRLLLQVPSARVSPPTT